MAHNKNKNFFLGAFVGSVLGGMTALLFAPKSGERLRRDISKQYNNVSEKTGEMFDRVGYRAQEMARTLSGHASEIVEKAKDFAEKAKDAAEEMSSEIKVRKRRK